MSTTYELTGDVAFIGPTTQVNDIFRKREFVVRVADGQYDQHVKLQVTQDRCATLDSLQIGQQVKVAFNLRGRPFVKDGNTIYFTNLEAWRIEPITQSIPGSLGTQSYSPLASQSQANAFDDDVAF